MALSRSFRKEVQKQTRLAIAAGIGFVIAYAWKEAIFKGMLNYVSRIMDVAPDHYLSETYTAIVITLLGVVALLCTSNLLKE
jgi:hypothetical protein